MTNPVGSRIDRPDGSGRFGSAWKRAAVAAVAVLVAFVALLMSLRYGGGAGLGPLPGLPDPGPTDWLVPIGRLVAQLAAVTTLGLLLAAAILSPRDQGRLSALATADCGQRAGRRRCGR